MFGGGGLIWSCWSSGRSIEIKGRSQIFLLPHNKWSLAKLFEEKKCCEALINEGPQPLHITTGKDIKDIK